jgi:response regulator RpfG family c-di-GMP phosphodiesterase
MKSGHTVLIVDDEAAILEALRVVLEKEGLTVFTAGSGMEGIDLIRSGHQFSLIISDQRMPEMQGVEFLEQVRLLAPQTQRILLTGYPDRETLIGGINRGGIHRYIGKPWKNEDLSRHVREALEQYEQALENTRMGFLGRWYHSLASYWAGSENESAP